MPFYYHSSRVCDVIIIPSIIIVFRYHIRHFWIIFNRGIAAGGMSGHCSCKHCSARLYRRNHRGGRAAPGARDYRSRHRSGQNPGRDAPGPGRSVRLAQHIHNDRSEIDRLLEVLPCCLYKSRAVLKDLCPACFSRILERAGALGSPLESVVQMRAVTQRFFLRATAAA